jgi:hypothetical protein
MTSLTATAYYTRKGINIAILGVAGYIVLKIFWSVFVAMYLMFFPPQPPPPNHAFGKLPPVSFPAPVASPSGAMTYRLETIEGYVPHASDAATVYFVKKNSANLLGLPAAVTFAKRMSFGENPAQESKNVYRFSDPDVPLRTMRYDIVTKNFVLRYAYDKDLSIFADRNLPSVDDAKKEARNFLQTYGLYEDTFATGQVAVSYLRMSGDKLVPAPSVSQSDAIRLDFFRAAIGDMKMVTPYPDEGPVSFIVCDNKDMRKRILQVSYTYWPIDTENYATYGLKTSNEAWTELQSGGGYIARYPKNGTQAVIRRVYLAYYDAFEPQTYLQPVFVFEGDDGFLAYVPAILPEWTE